MSGHRNLRVYQISYELAMEIFRLTRTFPPDERYSLTDQIRRSSRSVPANIAEGYRKRQYPKMFVNKMSDADGECTETQTWLDFACDCGYISREIHSSLSDRYDSVGSMLGKMIKEPEKFMPRGNVDGIGR
ncbi:MAG: four helix bundle protein [Acidobacteria bacterium]|nr:four helix bundle protein [Acidobacteriota bacterium]